MTGLASRVRHGLDSRPEIRLGAALLLACAAHAAVILGIELPAPDSGFGTRALHLDLIVESVPAAPEPTSPEALADAARNVPGLASPDSGTSALPHSRESSRTPGTSVSPPGRAAAPRPDAEPTRSGAIDSRTAEAGSTTGGSSLSYSELAREIAGAHALRERADTVGAGGTRTKRLAGNTAKSAVEAAYLDMWRQKTERIGRANYPPGGLSGELLLLAVIRRDGALHEVRVLESSGHPALDEAATRTVRLAAPYPDFPTEMRKTYDRLEIVRRWRYEREGALVN